MSIAPSMDRTQGCNVRPFCHGFKKGGSKPLIHKYHMYNLRVFRWMKITYGVAKHVVYLIFIYLSWLWHCGYIEYMQHILFCCSLSSHKVCVATVQIRWPWREWINSISIATRPNTTKLDSCVQFMGRTVFCTLGRTVFWVEYDQNN